MDSIILRVEVQGLRAAVSGAMAEHESRLMDVAKEEFSKLMQSTIFLNALRETAEEEIRQSCLDHVKAKIKSAMFHEFYGNDETINELARKAVAEICK